MLLCCLLCVLCEHAHLELSTDATATVTWLGLVTQNVLFDNLFIIRLCIHRNKQYIVVPLLKDKIRTLNEGAETAL